MSGTCPHQEPGGSGTSGLTRWRIAPLVGLPEDASTVEGLRSKLKRLVVRGWLAEDVPGLFAARMRADAEDAPGSGR